MNMICSLVHVKLVHFQYCDEFCTNAAYWTVIGQNGVFKVGVWLHQGSLNSNPQRAHSSCAGQLITSCMQKKQTQCSSQASFLYVLFLSDRIFHSALLRWILRYPHQPNPTLTPGLITLRYICANS